MKYLLPLFLVLLMLVPLFSQVKVEQNPRHWNWIEILGTDGGYMTGPNSDGRDTTDAVDISRYRGASTLWFEVDTTGLGSVGYDSCMTIYQQLYNKETETWGYYYNDSVGKIDTVARSIVNVGTGAFYVPLGGVSEWAWSSQARWIIAIGVGDSLKYRVFYGGQ